MHHLKKLIGLAVAVGLVGCAPSNKQSYANVSGTVTYNGKPLEKGQITFSCDGRAPTSADIVDGKYTGQAMVGTNRISIAAYRKAAKERQLPPQALAQYKAYQERNKGAPGAEIADPTLEDYIPPEYGLSSKQTRVVEGGAPNTFDFNIKGK